MNDEISWAAAPGLVALRCRSAGLGGFKPLNHVRELSPLPVEERFGPPDEVPAAAPSETLLAALGSCLGADIRVNAATGNVTVHSLRLEVEADITASPMRRLDRMPQPIGFEALRVTVRMVADAPSEALHSLFVHAPLWSPVRVTTRDECWIHV